VHQIPQKWFNGLMLAFTAIASLRLMGMDQAAVFMWTQLSRTIFGGG
jgi:hypothetical protein